MPQTILVSTPGPRGPQGPQGIQGPSGPARTLDSYIFTLDTNNGFVLTGSAAPQSSIVISDIQGNNFRHTPTAFDFPNANEMWLEGTTMWIGYNWAFQVYNTASLDAVYRLVRLEDVVVDFDTSTLSYTVADDVYVTSGSEYFFQCHGNDESEDYLFLTSRGSGVGYANIGFQAAKVNKYDFTDIEIFKYDPPTYGMGEICRYYNGYLYVQCQNGYSQLKVLKINANDLSDYQQIITGPSGYIGVAGAIEIYKNQIYTVTGYQPTKLLLLKYNMDGQLLASSSIYPTTGSFYYNQATPHSSTIKDNYWYITQTYSYSDILKIDIDTLELVDNLTLNPLLQTSITDDIAIGPDGNLWIGTEDNTFIPAGYRDTPKIYKVDLQTFTATKIADLNKSSFGTFSVKNQTLRDLYKPFTYNFNGDYVGDLTVTGSMTFTGLFSNPDTLLQPVTTKTGYNSLLVGPITNQSDITVVTGSILKII